MKAVIYARYSSDSQREESIEGQLRECTAFAEKNGITVLKCSIMSSKLYHIHHCLLHIKRRFGVKHQGQLHAVSIVYTGVHYRDIVQCLLTVCRVSYGKMQRHRICKRTTGRLPEENCPLFR